jgi:hypothetical protein
VVMEWMATITGDHVSYPGFQDLGDFSPILGSKNLHIFWRRIFAVESYFLVYLFSAKLFRLKDVVCESALSHSMAKVTAPRHLA